MDNKHLILILLVILPFFTFGQIDTSKYEYLICIYHKAQEQPKVIRNELINSSDTSIAIISGKIYDYKKNPLEFAVLNIISLTDSSIHGAMTDISGNYKLELPGDIYKLTALYVGLSEVEISKLKILEGEIREIDFKLGQPNSFVTYLIKSDKPLSPRQLKRKERKIKKEFNKIK